MLRTLINKVNTRRFALLPLIAFIIPFFIFSFWNHLSVDDYFIGVKKQTDGFWHIQYYYYTQWGGRYISILSTSILVFTNLLYSKTYLIGIYFLSASILAFFYVTHQINEYLLKRMMRISSLFLISLLLLIAELNIIPQPVTAFYWYSGAITYQQPFIFLLLLMGSLIALFHHTKHRKLHTVAAILFLGCMQGYNEMLTIWFLLFTTPLAAYYLYKEQKNKGLIISLMLYSYIAASILLLAPGNFHRAASFDKSSLIASFGISAVKFIVLNWFFLKEPLWWLLLSLLLLNIPARRELLKNALFKLLSAIKLLHLLIIYCSLGIFTYLPILYASNGSIPPRMENQICFLFGLSLIFILYLKLPETIQSDRYSILYTYRFLAISIFIFSTSNMERIVQTISSGFVYHKVMEERLQKLQKAHLMQQPAVSLDNYLLAVQRKINNYFPGGTRKTFRELMEQKPPLLFFTDDLNYSNNLIVLQHFYKIDTIIVNTQDSKN